MYRVIRIYKAMVMAARRKCDKNASKSVYAINWKSVAGINN